VVPAPSPDAVCPGRVEIVTGRDRSARLAVPHSPNGVSQLPRALGSTRRSTCTRVGTSTCRALVCTRPSTTPPRHRSPGPLFGQSHVHTAHPTTASLRCAPSLVLALYHRTLPLYFLCVGWQQVGPVVVCMFVSVGLILGGGGLSRRSARVRAARPWWHSNHQPPPASGHATMAGARIPPAHRVRTATPLCGTCRHAGHATRRCRVSTALETAPPASAPAISGGRASLAICRIAIQPSTRIGDRCGARTIIRRGHIGMCAPFYVPHSVAMRVLPSRPRCSTRGPFGNPLACVDPCACVQWHRLSRLVWPMPCLTTSIASVQEQSPLELE
jgi:hypothetical protein